MLRYLSVACFTAALTFTATAMGSDLLRIGIIGLDTSHSPALVKTFNDPKPKNEVFKGFKVVAAYPLGSQSIESSFSRIPKYTADVLARGVKIVDSIDQLLAEVDCVCLETNDGTLHLQQALQVFRAGKPVFIDKPVGSDLAETLAIFRASEHYQVPMFSASSLRYMPGAQAVRGGKIGDVLGCQAHGPFKREPSHVDLFWYGIHAVETLYTCMGPGCQSVSHTATDVCQFSMGTWEDGRLGTVRLSNPARPVTAEPHLEPKPSRTLANTKVTSHCLPRSRPFSAPANRRSIRKKRLKSMPSCRRRRQVIPPVDKPSRWPK